MLTVGSLFAGIGGFDLGFERAGFEIRWQVEIDPFCQAVLAKHWPDVRRYDDVRTTHVAHTRPKGCSTRGISSGVATLGEQNRRRGITNSGPDEQHSARQCGTCLEPVDVICGGFPCQPHSLAGRRGGASDERDLWPHFARLIRELEPRWVVAENVPGLLSSDAGRFFGTVLGDLAACGYDAEWDCLPASAFGAPHQRDRVWLVAYPNASSRRMERQRLSAKGRGCMADVVGLCADVADAASLRFDRSADAGSSGQETLGESEGPGTWCASAIVDASPGAVAHTHSDDGYRGLSDVQVGRIWGTGQAPRDVYGNGTEWRTEPDVGRVAHGVPARVDRLRGLGNSIVPQIAEWIARRIRVAEGE